jgi:V/A-type H+-transporting ATPase subunit E
LRKGSETLGSIETLTQRIIEDGNQEAQQIIREALEKVEKQLAIETEKTNEMCKFILEEAELEADKLYHQICSEKEMEIRDENLSIKQGVLDEVYEKALTELKSLNEEEYFAYLKNILSGKDLQDCVIQLPERYLGEKEERIRDSIAEWGTTGEYKLSSQGYKVESGCKLIKDGVEENYTFESWIRYYRQEMEGEILEILYGRG